MLFSDQLYSLPSERFPRGFRTTFLYVFHVLPILATLPPHLSLLYFVLTILINLYVYESSSPCNILNCSRTSRFLCTNIFLSTPFSRMLEFFYFFTVRDHISQTYKTSGKIFLYLISSVLQNSCDNDSSRTEQC
jgi:hypothetical protein